MRIKVSMLAAGLLLLFLSAAFASSTQVSADGSLVLDTQQSAAKLNSGDTLLDLETLGNQVQAYIYHGRTRVWATRFVSHGRKTTWKPASNPQLELLITKYSRYYQVDPSLVRAVMRHESGFNPRAVSPKGAQGLMQLMPGTAALMGVQNPFDPEQNIAGGVGYLRHCLDRFQHNIPLAVAAYNAGPAAVAKYANIPPYNETKAFVRNVLGTYGSSSASAPASAKKAKAKGKSKSRVKIIPRPRGPKIIEVKPRKESRPRAALAHPQ